MSSPSPKSKIPKSRPKGLGLTLKSHGPPPPPHHPAKKIDQVDSEIKDMFKKKFISK